MPVFVEWLDNQGLGRGVLKEESKTKLHLKTLTGKTIALPTKRFFIKHSGTGDAIDFFKGIEEQAAEVDLELLHDALGSDSKTSLKEAAKCWFSSDKPSTEELSTILWACANGAPWFKVDSSAFIKAASLEQLERLEKEKQMKARLQELLKTPSQSHEDFEKVCACFTAHLLGEDAISGFKALAKALKHEKDHMAFIRNWLQNAGSLPDPYSLKMMAFQKNFFNQTPRLDKKVQPCITRYPQALSQESDRIAEETEALINRLPSPLNQHIFSVDDKDVQEIDDAISCEKLEGDLVRVGVHIAAPGLLISEQSQLHENACSAYTTVYQPDMKWTMLPLNVIELFSLKAQKTLPAMSTYFTYSLKDFSLMESKTILEKVEVSCNLTYEEVEKNLEGGFFPDLELLDCDGQKTRAWFNRDVRDFPWEMKPSALKEMEFLVPLCRRLFCLRNEQGAQLFHRKEYRIKVSEDEKVMIQERTRNSLAEGVVSELMIHTNGYVAELLSSAGLNAIYRTQKLVDLGEYGYRTQADLTVVPREHAGLGGALYCWSTSPLRRYADLLNQRQLGSLVGGDLPAFNDPSELLVRAKEMEFQNKAANDHQRQMEKYWVLKHLMEQEGVAHPVEVMTRSNRILARFLQLPLVVEVSGEGSSPGAQYFTPQKIDLYDLTVTGRFDSTDPG